MTGGFATSLLSKNNPCSRESFGKTASGDFPVGILEIDFLNGLKSLNMRKFLFILFFLSFAVALPAMEELPVFCTTFPIYLFTKNLTKNCKNVRVELIIPAGTGCPHNYVLTPGDMRKLATENLILIRNGLGIDDFFLKPLAKMNQENRVIDATKGLRTLEEFSSCGHGHTHGIIHHHKHIHNDRNPHLFASPTTAMGMIVNIADGLEKMDPANAACYRANAEAYLEKLKKLNKQIEELSPLVKGHVIVAQHSIFDYLAEALGLKVAAKIFDETTSLSASEMKVLVRKIEEQNVSVIFTEPQYSARTAQAIAKECGIITVSLDPLASGPENAPDDYYEKVMENNLKMIKQIFLDTRARKN